MTVAAFAAPAGTSLTSARLPVEDGALAIVLPPGDDIGVRTYLQQRLAGGRGRVVEVLTLRSGRRLVVKSRNDRDRDREALCYQHLLSGAGALVPACLGSCTSDGVHLLALEHIDGRPCDPADPGDRDSAMAALARFHRCFPGSTVAAILGAGAVPELVAEVTPDPIERAALLTASGDALTSLAPVLPVPVHRRAEERMETVAAAIAASPLVLDPGDVRPENVLLTPDRTVLLDFENAAIRRSGLALAAMLEHWPDPWKCCGAISSTVPNRPMMSCRRWAAGGYGWPCVTRRRARSPATTISPALQHLLPSAGPWRGAVGVRRDDDMDLSRWFSDQLGASREVILWAIGQLSPERIEQRPPPWLGEWSAARHVAHLITYEQRLALPSMRQWLGGAMPAVPDRAEDQAIPDVARLLAEFGAIRAEQIALLPRFTDAHWQEPRQTVWGDVPLRWVVGKTLQHRYDHGNTLLRMALFPRPTLHKTTAQAARDSEAGPSGEGK